MKREHPVDSLGLDSEGVRVAELSSWQEFHERVMNLSTKRGYIWRGQQRDNDDGKPRFLTSSFDRTPRTSGSQRSRDQLLEAHLGKFKGEMQWCHPYVLPTELDDIWALGQHYGLKTPLLDWSLSPYIAAYFAFEKQPDGAEDVYRYVYALSRSVTRVLHVSKTAKEKRKNAVVGIVEKLAHHSPRFIAQKGIFTKVLEGNSIESAVRIFSKKRPTHEPLLVKFKIPTKDRDLCLRQLNLMNINHTSLVLDLRDVADMCNENLERKKTMDTTKYVY